MVFRFYKIEVTSITLDDLADALNTFKKTKKNARIFQATFFDALRAL
jgi:hypothetical protein